MPAAMHDTLSSDSLIEAFSAPVPRYTSYPSAPHFHDGIDASTYRAWLGALPPASTLSLYVHVPFCDRLCWFCACHTKQTRSYEPVARYVDALLGEIATVGPLVRGGRVTALHLGGGSPTLLRPRDMARLGDALRAAFDLRPDAEISVEIDPTDMDEDRYDALAAIGMTRASLGVQDFDETVQAAINRPQGFDVTRRVVEAVRARGVGSVNIDLLYGLPHQTVATVRATMERVLGLRPDRIALFGYAHVPWFKKHQSMIDAAALPGPRERFAQSTAAAQAITAAGYVQIGLDHFAMPSDPLAVAAKTGRLHRNFQGYTTDAAQALVGLGASAIGRLPQGFVQNLAPTGQYERAVRDNGLPVARGVAFSDDDRVRAFAIERLMCDFRLSRADLVARFGPASRGVLRDAEAALEDGLGALRRDGDDYVVPVAARPFVRSVAACLDAYLARGTARHSAAI
jgi:oxygen-independent coproporphyrinogen-3 oxidase